MIEGWTQVHGAGDEFDAGVVQTRLSAEGIPAHVFSQKDHLYVVTHGELAVIRVLVPASHFLRAREVLGHVDPGSSGTARCPLCDELLPPGSRECEWCGELPEPGSPV